MNYLTLKDIEVLYQNEGVTSEQLNALDTLLTAVARHLNILKKSIKSHNLPKSLNLPTTIKPRQRYKNWGLVIDHLVIEILPELYAFLHCDKNTNNDRRYIHQYLLNLSQTTQFWLSNITLVAADPQTHDNYLDGTGRNAQTAINLLKLVQVSISDNAVYIDYLDNILAIYTDMTRLESQLSLSTSALTKHIQEWQALRLRAFKKLDKDTLDTASYDLVVHHQHPVIDYLLDNDNPHNFPISRYSYSSQLTPTVRNTLINEVNDNTTSVIIFLSLTALFSGSLISVLIIMIMSIISSQMIFRHVQKNVILQKSVGKYLALSFIPALSNITVVFVALFVSSFFLTTAGLLIVLGLVLNVCLIGLQYCYDKTLKQIYLNPNEVQTPAIGVDTAANETLEPANTVPIPIDKDRGSNRISLNKQQRQHQSINNQDSNNHDLSAKSTHYDDDASNEQLNEDTNDNLSRTSSDTALLPVDIDRHTHSLKLILSDSAELVLKELVDTVNESYQSLDYLQVQHTYLATSIHELIIDIATHSLLRLNLLAHTFINEGVANPNAKKLFAEQYEKQVTELFCHHIEELAALNQSILERQMAGFSQTGTSEELEFRDSVMELKILLRWYVAQQTSNDEITTHHVILDSLQTTTLKQMMEAFYQEDSTTVQRRKLKKQIDELLAHFKSTTPVTTNDDADCLLKLSQQQEVTIERSDDRLNQSSTDIEHQTLESGAIDSVHAKLATQKFIDFNEHYINQIKKHW